MKKKLTIFIIVSAVMFTTSCMKDMPDSLNGFTVSVGGGGSSSGTTPEGKTLKASVESLSFRSDAGNQSFGITSNTDWRVSSDADWVKVSESTTRGSGNGTVTVSVQQNTATESRTGTVTISSTQAGSVQVSITQAGANSNLQLNKNSLSFTAAAGSDSFTITSNTSWTITSDQDWCTLSSSSGTNNATVTVYVSENTSTSSRNAAITVLASDITQTIAVTQTGADPYQEFTVNGVIFKMIRVDGGTFMMGATPEQGDDAFDNEKPAHSVTLSSYSIGETEVTLALWQAVMGNNPSWSSSLLAVNYVSWDDCQEFIRKLNSMTGQNFRLPTEAEWEFAARGGNNSREYKYSGSDTIGNVAWYEDNCHYTPFDTHEVATMAANELRLYDMSGNVYEWCQDWYGSYNSSSQINPIGPSSGSSRVLRGGCMDSSARFCRVSYRGYGNPDFRSADRGLRLAL